jgi:imidazolonepropionase-like amidohydrolase
VAAAALLLTLPGASVRAEDDDAQPDDQGADGKSPADVLVVSAAALHVGDGTVHRPGLLLIEDGRVKAAGSELDIPEGARRWDHPGSVITPGLVEASASVPLAGTEAGGALSTAALSTADARDPWDAWLPTVRGQGVVAASLAPTGTGTFHGRVATIGTTGPEAAGAPLLSKNAALSVSLESAKPGSAARASSRQALARELEETQRYGKSWKEWRDQDAEDAKRTPSELRRDERRRASKKDRSKRVKKPGRDEGREVLVQVLEKKLPLRVHADRLETVEAALATARRRGTALTITGCLECTELAHELSESRAIVLLSPLDLPILEGPRGEPDSELAASLDEAGVRIAVTGGGGWPVGPTWLRLAAADLVRRGVSRDHAVAAMTGEAAVAAGLGETHGRLSEGRDAEFVLWSGDPLAPGTRLERLVTPEETRLPDEDAPADTGEVQS